MGREGSRGAQGIEVGGTDAGATSTVVGGAEETGGGTAKAGTRGSPVCSGIGDRSPR